MKIAIVNKHRDDNLGGSELQCDFIATELSKREHEVLYIAVGGVAREYNKPYTVISCNFGADDIIYELSQIQPQIVYWRFNRHFFYPVVKYCQKKEIPFIFAASHINDVQPWNFFKRKMGIIRNLKRIYNSFWHQHGLKYVDALTVNNKDFLNMLSVSNQFFIPNGMTREFVPFNWDKPYCIWVANIKKAKRPQLYIKLAEVVKSDEIDFLMIGAIQDKKYSWIQDSGNLPSNVHYLGPKTPEEVNGALANSLLQIHTCHVEGFPNIFIQAWLQGVPSVTYGFDPSSYINDHEIGVTANEDWELFQKLVKELIENQNKRKQMGRNARNFAEKVFKIEKSVDKLEELMDHLVY